MSGGRSKNRESEWEEEWKKNKNIALAIGRLGGVVAEWCGWAEGASLEAAVIGSILQRPRNGVGRYYNTRVHNKRAPSAEVATAAESAAAAAMTHCARRIPLSDVYKPPPPPPPSSSSSSSRPRRFWRGVSASGLRVCCGCQRFGTARIAFRVLIKFIISPPSTTLSGCKYTIHRCDGSYNVRTFKSLYILTAISKTREHL